MLWALESMAAQHLLKTYHSVGAAGRSAAQSRAHLAAASVCAIIYHSCRISGGVPSQATTAEAHATAACREAGWKIAYRAARATAACREAGEWKFGCQEAARGLDPRIIRAAGEQAPWHSLIRCATLHRRGRVAQWHFPL